MRQANPPSSRPVAIHGSAGSVAATSARQPSHSPPPVNRATTM